MKRIFWVAAVLVFAVSCKDEDSKGKFTVKGELKNTIDQKIYLEQVYFNQKDPEVLDTGTIRNGRFEVSATGNEEGLYRLRFEKQEVGYIFINDAPKINFKADINDMSLQGPDFNTPANHAFKAFIMGVDQRQRSMDRLSLETDSLEKIKASDSIIREKIISINAAAADYKKFIVKSIDTASDPVVAMFALGYTRGIDPAELKASVADLAKRFPTHQGVAGIIARYNEMIAKANEPEPAAKAGTGIGSMAPEISMTDTSGKTFLLSSLRGKYVLVDFWASWCGPCRMENPNVVANYKKYKTKNFTILGVSLDDDRKAWVKAIQKDGLEWKQVSDLKGWQSAAATSYGFEAIPYNVLLDPQGKIIATELREEALGKKLEEVLK